MKIIITGATGMVGEGVLIACIGNAAISKILMVNRKTSPIQHPKVEELLIPNFTKLEGFESQLSGYDACFYCAGISSVGMAEDQYTQITYDTTLAFAQKLAALNSEMVFNFVSGGHTDSSEKGKIMWARVKGKTENALMKLPFRGEYNFRPGFMKPFKEQKNVKAIFKPVIWLFPLLFPSKSLTLEQVAQAMISVVKNGYPQSILEIADIKIAAQEK